MAFRGWPVEALEFFEALEAENTKSFWEAIFERVPDLGPSADGVAARGAEPEWGEGRIFRPYRDVRFSGDKTPYKTQIGAMIGDGYVQVDADGLAAGCGMGDGRRSARAVPYGVADDRTGGRLETIVASLARAAGLEVTARATLKTAPRGYPKDHLADRAPPAQGPHHLARVAGRRVAGDEEAKDRIVEFLRRRLRSRSGCARMSARPRFRSSGDGSARRPGRAGPGPSSTRWTAPSCESPTRTRLRFDGEIRRPMVGRERPLEPSGPGGFSLPERSARCPCGLDHASILVPDLPEAVEFLDRRLGSARP